jgi:hypothetical protein
VSKLQQTAHIPLHRSQKRTLDKPQRPQIDLHIFFDRSRAVTATRLHLARSNRTFDITNPDNFEQTSRRLHVLKKAEPQIITDEGEEFGGGRKAAVFDFLPGKRPVAEKYFGCPHSPAVDPFCDNLWLFSFLNLWLASFESAQSVANFFGLQAIFYLLAKIVGELFPRESIDNFV